MPLQRCMDDPGLKRSGAMERIGSSSAEAARPSVIRSHCARGNCESSSNGCCTPAAAGSTSVSPSSMHSSWADHGCTSPSPILVESRIAKCIISLVPSEPQVDGLQPPRDTHAGLPDSTSDA